jgi:Resolvase, N terminal domain/ABC transporter substrate binding protein
VPGRHALAADEFCEPALVDALRGPRINGRERSRLDSLGCRRRPWPTRCPREVRRCRLIGAKLVIAKLDRLSRDARFLLGLEKAGEDFVAADTPQANRLTIGMLTIGIMAVMAQHERDMISERTKAALAAAKRRGVKLGGFRGVRFTAKHVKLAVAAYFREAGRPINRIPRGTKPAEIPVEQPTKFELAVNLKTAKALGLAIPESLLLRTDEVIE